MPQCPLYPLPLDIAQEFAAFSKCSGAGGGGADRVHVFDLWISPITGDDATGDGSLTKPFKTWTKAISKIPPAGNNYNVWATEKWRLCAGPGVHNFEPGPVQLRQLRRAIGIWGEGAILDFQLDLVEDPTADWPDGAGFLNTNMPPPWNPLIGSPLAGFDIFGDRSGMEGGQVGNNIIFLQKVTFTFMSPLPPSGFQAFVLWDHVQLEASFEARSLVPGQRLLTEINDSSLRPTTAVFGSDGVGGNPPLALFQVKAHNSQLLAGLRGDALLLEIDGCRLGDVDSTRDLNGAPYPTGLIQTNTAAQFGGLVDCAASGSVYKFGSLTGPGPYTVIADVETIGRLLAAAPAMVINNGAFKVFGVVTGTLAQRPTALVPNGFPYFATDAVPPRELYKLGAGWVDGAGTVVP
jgi:hypothetical protein